MVKIKKELIMNCLLQIDDKLYTSMYMCSILMGSVEPNGIAKAIKVNKQFGLIISKCDVLITNVQHPWDILPKKLLKSYSRSEQSEIIVITVGGNNFTLDKNTFIVSGEGEMQLERLLEQNKKI